MRIISKTQALPFLSRSQSPVQRFEVLQTTVW